MHTLRVHGYHTRLSRSCSSHTRACTRVSPEHAPCSTHPCLCFILCVSLHSLLVSVRNSVLKKISKLKPATDCRTSSHNSHTFVETLNQKMMLPRFQLATPLGFQANHMPKGNLVTNTKYVPGTRYVTRKNESLKKTHTTHPSDSRSSLRLCSIPM